MNCPVKRSMPAAQSVAVASSPIAVIHTIPYAGIVSTILVTDQRAIVSATKTTPANAALNRWPFALNRRMVGASKMS